MATGAPDKKVEKSYLTSAVESMNPWAASRSTTPTQGNKQTEIRPPAPPSNPDDHSTTHLYGQSFKTYPQDCPPLNVQWFHAVDVPKRKPQVNNLRKKAPPQPEKPPGRPKKFSAFSASDSRSIENEYQKLLEATEVTRVQSAKTTTTTRKRKASESSMSDFGEKTITNVPVNEDFLFDVGIEARELAPVYWLGPVYEVRRGTWFYTDGSTLRPCEENLAAQLEEGYLKVKPWLSPARDRSPSGAKKPVTPKGSRESLKDKATTATLSTATTSTSSAPETKTTAQSQPQPLSYRLFGTHMNSVATYQDAKTAWMSSDGMLSWVTSSVYERFSGGGYMSGVKVVRGYSEPSKSKEKEKPKEKDPKGTSTPPVDPLGLDQRQQNLIKKRSKSVSAVTSKEKEVEQEEAENAEVENRNMRLQRQLSSLMGTDGRNKEETEEEIRKREEQEIQDDYNAQAGETQGREIEHLVLVTHGIGQQLSLRMDSINFVHDVNVMRKTIKSVYTGSADLKALNSEFGAGPGNCRVQVLPVCWRHLLDFPKKRERQGEHDLGEVEDEEDEYPSLEDITIEGVAFARSLISDLALDVLLYQSAYREQISKIVLHECNRIYRLFKERNPEFKGKVHLVGHSLGSAILFDMLCRQKAEAKHKEARGAMRFWSSPEPKETHHRDSELQFEFDVDDFFCLGSPIGLFQMLKGRTIAARQSLQEIPVASPFNPDHMDDPFLTANNPSSPTHVSPVTGLPFSVSSPKTGQLFNIFHPSDPISYRLEPLISPAMKELKPQLLPYTKKGIFGNVAPQGLAGIGAKVGQSVGGLWSSFSAGIASGILNRSLGLTSEEVARMTANASASENQVPGAGTNIAAGGVIPDVSKMGEKTAERKKQLADSTALEGSASLSGNNPTLIDDDLETLYSKFQKNRAETVEDASRKMQDDERKARKMRAEESKVRALNRNGRVDYSIQESVLDFNPMNTIASHMGYWADEDVTHFVLSQLLSSRTNRKH